MKKETKNMGAAQSLMGLVPELAPAVFIYFDIAGQYLGFGSTSMAVAGNATIGAFLGKIAFDFMTNTKMDLWDISKQSAALGLGAFVGARFVLPMISMQAGPGTQVLAAMIGGWIMRWLVQMF